jgi:hypothetical protein
MSHVSCRPKFEFEKKSFEKERNSLSNSYLKHDHESSIHHARARWSTQQGRLPEAGPSCSTWYICAILVAAELRL